MKKISKVTTSISARKLSSVEKEVLKRMISLGYEYECDKPFFPRQKPILNCWLVKPIDTNVGIGVSLKNSARALLMPVNILFYVDHFEYGPSVKGKLCDEFAVEISLGWEHRFSVKEKTLLEVINNYLERKPRCPHCKSVMLERQMKRTVYQPPAESEEEEPPVGGQPSLASKLRELSAGNLRMPIPGSVKLKHPHEGEYFWGCVTYPECRGMRAHWKVVDDDPAVDKVLDKVKCPDCESPMVLRRARRGPNAGKTFFGCLSYPACKGTMEKSEALARVLMSDE